METEQYPSYGASVRLRRNQCEVYERRGVQVVEPHQHLFLELSYIFEGRVVHTRNGKKQILSPGDYLIVDFGSLHDYRACDASGFSNFDLLFLPELLDPALSGTRCLRALLEHYLLHFNLATLTQNPADIVFRDEDGRVRELILRIQEAQEKQEAGFNELMRCYMVEILIFTMRKIEGIKVVESESAIGHFLTAFVAEHYAEEISLGELAAQMNYSLPYVSRRFRQEIGVGFVEYLQNYRVMQACRLLVDSRLSFTEITWQVGYRDSKCFGAVFKRTTGVSPTEFRRRYRDSH